MGQASQEAAPDQTKKPTWKEQQEAKRKAEGENKQASQEAAPDQSKKPTWKEQQEAKRKAEGENKQQQASQEDAAEDLSGLPAWKRDLALKKRAVLQKNNQNNQGAAIAFGQDQLTPALVLKKEQETQEREAKEQQEAGG